MDAGVKSLPGERVFVGLGANRGGDSQLLLATLASALRHLQALPQTAVVAVSGVWRSAPVDATGPDYLNAVAELQTALKPLPLLRALQRIEAAHGRERPFHHAPRSLDLDLLFYGQREIDAAGLTLPHPRLHERAFVLEPLAELAPALAHPRLGSLQPWRERCAGQTLQRWPGVLRIDPPPAGAGGL